jgi:hypothetical protein
VRYATFRRRAFLLLVFVDKSEPEDYKDQELEAVRHKEGADAQLILGRLAGEVEEGGDDIADTRA